MESVIYINSHFIKNAVFYTHDINSGVSGFNKINMESKDSININEVCSKCDTKAECRSRCVGSCRKYCGL